MPTREAHAVLALALLIFFVAFNLQSGWVYAVDALLIGLLVAGMLSAQHAVWRVSVVHDLPAEAIEGESVGVGLTLRAAGRARRYFVAAVDTVPGLEPAEVFLSAIEPRGGTRTWYVTRAVRRGIHRASSVTLRSHGLTGLFDARRVVPARGEITVYPRFWRLSRFSPSASVPAFQQAGVTRRRGGLEFYGLRDYRSGDSVRHVHWRSSARRGSLMVREFEQEVPGSVTLLIDTRPDVHVGVESENTFEDLIRAAASIAWYVTVRGGTVRLLAATASGTLDLTGGWKPVLRALAELQPDGLVSPAAVLSSVAMGRDGSIIALTPDPGSLTAVTASGARVVGIVADPHSYAEGAAGALTGRIAAPGTAACIIRRGDNIGARLEQCDR